MQHIQKIKELMKIRDMNVESLAEGIGKKPAVVYQYLSGRTEMTITRLLEIANALGATASQILEGVTIDNSVQGINIGSNNVIAEVKYEHNNLSEELKLSKHKMQLLETENNGLKELNKSYKDQIDMLKKYGK